MPEQDAPYDPYIPSGQSGNGGHGQGGEAGGNQRTQALQAVGDPFFFFRSDSSSLVLGLAWVGFGEDGSWRGSDGVVSLNRLSFWALGYGCYGLGWMRGSRDGRGLRMGWRGLANS